MTSPPNSDPTTTPPRHPGKERGRARERRALLWGFGLSVVIHLGALVLYPMLMDRVTPDLPSVPEMTPDEVIPGFEVIALRELVEEVVEPPAPDVPMIDLPDEEEEEFVLPEPAPPAPPIQLPPADEDADEVGPPEDEAVEAEEDLRTLAERLQPGPGDIRLWSYLLPDRSDMTDAERANMLLEGMLHAFNDSIAVAAALADQAQDWTYTDSEGRRWGLSPGRLHLGDFSIPLPISFEAPPSLSNEFARRQWEIADIMRGVTTAEIRETWSQRAREIRERMDAERGQNRPDGGG